MKPANLIKRLFYTVICGVFLFSIIFLRSWHLIGPISWRNMSAILLFFVAFVFTPKVILKDKCINGYIVWLFMYIFVNMITGYITTEHVYKNLIGYHMVSLMLLFSVPRLIKDHRQLKLIICLLGIFYIANALITVLQFFNNSIAWGIGDYISPMNLEKAERMEYLSASSDNMLSYSVCTGLNGFVVTNGQFIACFAPIVTFFSVYNKLKYKIFSTIVLLGILITSICVQQRMCFLVTLLYCVIILYYTIGSVKKLIPIVLIGCLLFICSNVDTINFEIFGRIFDFTDNHRTHIGEYFSMFLSNTDYILLGHCTVSSDANNELFLTMGHNALLDSFRRGGILCFIIYIYLVVIILLKIYRITKVSIKHKNVLTIELCIVVFLNLCYSFTHSDGIPSGSVFFWGAYALMIASYYIDRNSRCIQSLSHAKSI